MRRPSAADGGDRRLTGGREIALMLLQALQRGAASGRHARAIRLEVRSAGLLDSGRLRLGRLLGDRPRGRAQQDTEEKYRPDQPAQ